MDVYFGQRFLQELIDGGFTEFDLEAILDSDWVCAYLLKWCEIGDLTAQDIERMHASLRASIVRTTKANGVTFERLCSYAMHSQVREAAWDIIAASELPSDEQEAVEDDFQGVPRSALLFFHNLCATRDACLCLRYNFASKDYWAIVKAEALTVAPEEWQAIEDQVQAGLQRERTKKALAKLTGAEVARPAPLVDVPRQQRPLLQLQLVPAVGAPPALPMVPHSNAAADQRANAVVEYFRANRSELPCGPTGRSWFNGGNAIVPPASTTESLVPVDATSPFFAQALALTPKEGRAAFKQKVVGHYAKDRNVLPVKVQYPTPGVVPKSLLERRVTKFLLDRFNAKEVRKNAALLVSVLHARIWDPHGEIRNVFALHKFSWNAGTQNQMRCGGHSWMRLEHASGETDEVVRSDGLEGLELEFFRNDHVNVKFEMNELACQRILFQEGDAGIGCMASLHTAEFVSLICLGGSATEQVSICRWDFKWLAQDRLQLSHQDRNFDDIFIVNGDDDDDGDGAGSDDEIDWSDNTYNRTCAHTHTHMHTHTHTHAHTHACTRMHTHGRTCAHTQTHAHMHVHARTHARTLKVRPQSTE